MAPAIACFLPSIVLRRLPWYKTLFNVAMHALPGIAAHLVAATGDALPMAPAGGLRTVGVLAAAAVTFVALNYLLLVIVIAATARIAPARAFGSVAEGIPLDVGLAVTGAALAALWSASQALAALAAGPMALIYHALRVPMLTHQVETDDAKTGLFNFPYLRQRMHEALEAARRSDLPVTVVMVDMDNLRVINNSSVTWPATARSRRPLMWPRGGRGTPRQRRPARRSISTRAGGPPGGPAGVPRGGRWTRAIPTTSWGRAPAGGRRGARPRASC